MNDEEPRVPPPGGPPNLAKVNAKRLVRMNRYVRSKGKDPDKMSMREKIELMRTAPRHIRGNWR